ncbi:MAG: DUF3054 domain-containing protein [Acidimicrobiia bacterium]
MKRTSLLVIAGDLLVIAVIVLIGFATHGELELEPDELVRMVVLFLEISLLWGLIGQQLGVFAEPILTSRFNWQVPMTMLIAAPFSALMRAVILGIPVSPAFILVITAVTTAGITVWRFALASIRGTGTRLRARPGAPGQS